MGEAVESSADGRVQAAWPQGFCVKLRLGIDGLGRRCKSDRKELMVTVRYGMLLHGGLWELAGQLQISGKVGGGGKSCGRMKREGIYVTAKTLEVGDENGQLVKFLTHWSDTVSVDSPPPSSTQHHFMMSCVSSPGAHLAGVSSSPSIDIY